MELKPIDQQVVVIIGATSGIGRDAALRFAEEGATVVVTGRSGEALNTLVSEIEQSGGTASSIVIEDVARFDDMRRVVEETINRYGRIDTWIQAAAVSMYARAEDTMPGEYERIIDVNLLGSIYGARAVLPALRNQGGGSLIHITSTEAKRSLPYHSAYAASKHGVKGFLDALRVELEHDEVPINVVNIMPASVNTPFFSKSMTRLGVKPAPYPPVYDPSVVSSALLFAATHKVDEMYAGGAGRMMGMLQKVAPGMADRMLVRSAFRLQRTDIPKSPNAPHNLYEHISGHDVVEGDYEGVSKPLSIVTWLRTHPGLRWGLSGLALVGSAFFVGRGYMRRNCLTTKDVVTKIGETRLIHGAAMLPATIAGTRLVQRMGDMRMPRQVGPIKFRRRLGPIVLPGRIGPIRTKGRIGPMTIIPAKIGPVSLPEKVGPVTVPAEVGPFAMPRVFAVMPMRRMRRIRKMVR